MAVTSGSGSAGSGGSTLFLTLICLAAAVGGFLFGFDTAVISGTFGFVEKQFALSKLQVGWFGSAALAGCVLGAMSAGWLGDRFGRKPVLLAGAAFFFVSTLFSAVPPTFTVLIGARLVGGVGVGMTSVLAPLYISEFAPPRIRGRLVALYQLSIVVGILLAYYSNWALLRFSETGAAAFGGRGLWHWLLVEEVWRGMFAAELIPNFVFILLLLLVPETPRWLVAAGRPVRASALLERVNGREAAARELAEIQASLNVEEGTLRELFRPGLRTALAVGVGLSVFGQMTGVNAVIYYGPDILKAAGLRLGGAMGYQVALGVINLVFTALAVWKVDDWGRRPLLIRGMAAVTLSLGTAGALFAAELASGVLIVCALGVYIGCVALSICAVIWVLTPEIFPNRIRGRAMSVAVLANWTVNAAIAFVFPWFAARLGMHAVFLTFAGICFVATLFFWRFVPETKGKSLEAIEAFWLGKRRNED
jgi:SP family arabinose:H+ symporter-like MFS transporter